MGHVHIASLIGACGGFHHVRKLVRTPDQAPFPVQGDQQGSLLSRLSVGALLAVTHQTETRSSQTVAAPVLQGRFDFTPEIAADLDWGFAAERDSEGSISARSGNPWLKGWYRGKSGFAKAP